MTKKLIMLGMTGIFSMAYSQVGINTSAPQGILHIDGQKNNPAIGSPSVIQRTDDVVITSSGSIGVGTLSPITKIDARANPGNATPGNGPIGIGETILAATAAGAGAVRYSTGSGGVLQYSNGTNWNTISSNVQKSTVIASKQTSFQVADQSVTNITGWTSTIDINNDFNESTGVFTAPRTGNYQVSFSFTFDNGEGNYNDKSWIEAVITLSNGTRRVSAIPVPTQTNTYAGANVSFTIRLNAGATVRPTIYHFSGSRKWLRIDQAGFNNFSVVEL